MIFFIEGGTIRTLTGALTPQLVTTLGRRTKSSGGVSAPVYGTS